MDKQYKFLCQNCLLVVVSHDWDYYHLKEDSCPHCHSEMCGCPDCVKFAEEKTNKEDWIFEQKTPVGAVL